MGELAADLDRIQDIASRLDLRAPNREAVESIVLELSLHYDVDGRPPPFEAVVDSATGVGKTWIMAGAMEYLAGASGVRNFAVITPGRTILDKTIANFRSGHPKSLLGPMQVQPVVVTADNFNTAAMRVEMDDDSRTKLFIFTVQALTRPKTNLGRRTHRFQEGLGEAFYEHLQQLNDLVVFADEHHTYYGKAFSSAVRDLDPYALVGLTATPHKQTPEDQIIYRYPLAAAIADRWVKTPVIVGRKDDRSDLETKLADGVNLLKAKAEVAASYTANQGLATVNPVMLVVAQTIDEAEEVGSILRSAAFDGGGWADGVLVVHSDAPDEALDALAAVEDSDSPVRVIISVGMLKEGWDVKNVYVIVSIRASVSTVLTEQTLGRGLRLPWGHYTDVEMLDTLEVLAHERYEDLLKKAGVLNESFIDQRTRAVLRQNSAGQIVAVRETENVGAPVLASERGSTVKPGEGVTNGVAAASAPIVTDVGHRTEVATTSAGRMRQEITPRPDLGSIAAPVLRMTKVVSEFSLADITDLEAFRQLGTQIAANPEEELRRVKVSARVIEGADGMRRTEMITTTAADKVGAASSLLPLEDLRRHLRDALLASPIVPARKQERNAVGPLLDAFVDGMGGKAESVLSAYLDRATTRLVALVTAQQRRFAPQPKYEEVVEIVPIGGVRVTDKVVSSERAGRYLRSLAYDGWTKSLYPVNWFDSAPEREVANIVDDADQIDRWVRLKTGDLPILWRNDGREYNADLIVVDKDATRWVIEVKSDKDATSDEVQGKREAARRWVNHVNAEDNADEKWAYLLVTETDIAQAKGSWSALSALGRR
jgi:type III restriction enzyme